MNDKTTNETVQQIAFPIARTVNLLPETLDLIKRADEFGALSVSLQTTDDRVTAADQLAKIKGLAKSLDEKRAEMKKPFDEAGREVQSYFKPKLDALSAVEAAIKKAILDYDAEAERQLRIAEARAAEEARKEREKLEEKAEKLESKGKAEQADAVRENAATIVAAPVSTPIPPAIKTAGTSTRKKYSAKVTDLMALVKAVAEGKAPLTLIQADQSALDKMAVALKDGFKGMFPGVELDVENTLSQRSKNPF